MTNIIISIFKSLSRLGLYVNDTVITDVAAEYDFALPCHCIFLYYLVIRKHVLPNTSNLNALRMRLRILSRIPFDVSTFNGAHNVLLYWARYQNQPIRHSPG